MATISVNGISFGYDELGDPGDPTVVFAHSLIWDRQMFDEVVPLLADSYHIINFDQHGHGETGFRPSLTLEDMAEDYAALVEAWGFGPVHWAGLSIGGMTGMRLALARPDLLKSLILMNASSQPEMEDRFQSYMMLAGAIRSGQAASVVDAILPYFFSPSTYSEQPGLIKRYREKLQAEGSNEGMYQAAVAVFTRKDITDLLDRITAPALVIAGEQDIATPLDRSERMAERLPNSRLVVIPDAAHMSATEQPALVARVIRDFLHGVEGVG
jgi:3-oxoadipate enol-lactonase